MIFPVRYERRRLLTAGLGLTAGEMLGRTRRAQAKGAPLVDFRGAVREPVKIEALEILRAGREHLLRVRAAGGATGVALTNQHIAYLQPMLKQRVFPSFIGKDARELASLIDQVYVAQSNYKLVGLPFWNCVAWVEFAILDLLGRLAGRSIGALLAGGKPPLRRELPVYLSSTDRHTTPEQEVERFQRLIEKTGARAVKFKVGGRMSGNEDAAPGRTETIIALMRKRLGDDITLYADANGSFDVKRGIEVGRMLEAHGVSIFEEPCPFEDYQSNRLVNRALRRLTLAGGEQDSSYWRFQEIVRDRVYDVVQPDLAYNGGFLRTMRVGQLARAAGREISPHCPQLSGTLYVLHFAAFTPNLGPFQEIHVNQVEARHPFEPALMPVKGVLPIPTAPGLGVTFDPDLMKQAVVV